MDSDDDGGFEQADAGASDTMNVQAGTIKKGGYVMLKGFPCKVTDFSTAKPGKHGSAKASIVGKDIFTGRQYEDSCPTAANILVPIVKKTEFTLVDITQDDFVELLSQNNEMKSDLKLPKDDEDLIKRIKEASDKPDTTVMISVLSACGTQKIVDMREK